jgi:ABC-type multidrug transport system fused ATPase/permease subunit
MIILFRSCNLTGSNFTYINYDLSGRTRQQIILLIIIGCISLVCGYIRVILLDTMAERQIRTIRQTLFQSILKKDMAYFDKHKTGELSLCLTNDVNKIRDGIGNKFGTAIEMVTTCVSALIIGKVSFV